MRALLVLLLLATGLTACGGSDDPAIKPAINPAPSASTAGCASLLTRLPGTLLGRAKGSAEVAGAAVWGDPPIVLRCGVTPPRPSADTCIDANGVDWLFAENDSAYVFTTYGRTPAAELSVPASIDRTQAPGALAQLSTAVSALPATGQCDGP